MPAAIFILLGCQLAGEVVRAAFHLPIPGPVIGMFLLAAGLAWRQRGGAGDERVGMSSERVSQAAPLERVSDALISHMGLLFVPAGVGVIAEAGVLRTQWFPILAALVGSTILSLMVTGLVMHWVSRAAESRAARPRIGHAKLEARS
jgi:holin-like protein